MTTTQKLVALLEHIAEQTSGIWENIEDPERMPPGASSEDELRQLSKTLYDRGLIKRMCFANGGFYLTITEGRLIIE